MKWVTWEHIGVDRMGSAWLIQRFIDKQAEFIFIAHGSTLLPKGCEPFDIPGVRYSHHGGHCTFYVLLKEHKISDRVLERIAQIVDEADEIHEVAVEPAAPGLDLICRGLRQISRDDFEALERSRFIFEALYAELSKDEA